MDRVVSVIIPNYNGSETIGKCLEAVFSSDYRNFEVVVVDDCSTDNSREIIERFPCRLISLNKRSGASRARNVGAQNGKGDLLFFLDADCVMQRDALSLAVKAIAGQEYAVIGGTYTRIPYDDTFFSAFQSIFIHFSETKKLEPDYIASHAMMIDAGLFKRSGGFPEDFLPILEDVEFSHRIRRSGARLIMNPHILVQHIFDFTFFKSLKNALRKSMFWTMYSMKNRDILKDSGTASVELKTNVVFSFLMAVSLFLLALSGKWVYLSSGLLFFAVNLLISRELIVVFHRSKGFLFATAATAYYMTLFPLAVGAGVFAGTLRYTLRGQSLFTKIFRVGAIR